MDPANAKYLAINTLGQICNTAVSWESERSIRLNGECMPSGTVPNLL